MAKERYRKARKNNYTQVLNSMLWDSETSLQAKTLLSILISNSGEWELNFKEITQRSSNGRDAHYSAMNELIKKGYAQRLKLKDEKGKHIEMCYVFSDNKEEVKEEVEVCLTEGYVIEGYSPSARLRKSQDCYESDINITDCNINPLTDNTEVDKTEVLCYSNVTEEQESPLTDYPYLDNPNTDSQYINNNKGNNTNLNKTNFKDDDDKTTVEEARIIIDRVYQLVNEDINKRVFNTVANRCLVKLKNNEIRSSFEHYFMQSLLNQISKIETDKLLKAKATQEEIDSNVESIEQNLAERLSEYVSTSENGFISIKNGRLSIGNWLE